MVYFTSRDIAAISSCSALWGVLNPIFSPIFFRMFGLPFLCDLIGFSVLIVAAWWIRKFGGVAMVGLVSTALNFVINPGGIQFLGFTVASIVFDLVTAIIGYGNAFRKPAHVLASMMPTSVFSAATAGYIIGAFFMAGPALERWGGILGWAGLHAVGGVIGGVIGTFLITALISRRVIPQTISKQLRSDQLG